MVNIKRDNFSKQSIRNVCRSYCMYHDCKLCTILKKLGQDKFNIKPSMLIFAKFRPEFEISFAQSNIHIFVCLPRRLGNVRIDKSPADSNPGSVKYETVTVYFYHLCAWYPPWRTDFRPQQHICPQNHQSSLLTDLRVSNGERARTVHHDHFFPLFPFYRTWKIWSQGKNTFYTKLSSN